MSLGMASTSATVNGLHHIQPDGDPSTGPRNLFPGKPYFTALHELQRSFPALKSFLRKLANDQDEGRRAVKDHYEQHHHRSPGRCFCLVFTEESVTLLDGYENGFSSAKELEEYLLKFPAKQSREDLQTRRLFILEDMEPDYIEVLGHHLGIDPLVFSEQMNTWNYTDSWSVQNRALPSMLNPEQSWTLRYYELRTLKNPRSIDALTLQLTFAVNRRRYERWRDVDVPSAGKPDRRHGFVRRAASFWTSQTTSTGSNSVQGAEGWDALILVDPGMATACRFPDRSVATNLQAAAATGSAMNGLRQQYTRSSISSQPNGHGMTQRTSKKPRSIRRIPSTGGDPGEDESEEKVFPAHTTFILSDQRGRHDSRASLWKAQAWKKKIELRGIEHESWPYHDGCSTLVRLKGLHVGVGAPITALEHLRQERDLASPMEESIFYWTKIAPKSLIRQAHSQSGNTAFYLLKHISQHWINQLELINTTISKGEWVSDDYQAKVDDDLSLRKWGQDLRSINNIAKDINYMRRHLNHFWRAMILNLERVGITLGNESIEKDACVAIRDVQKDFLTIHNRMEPLRNRAEALNSVANDLANLRAAFRGVQDGKFSVRLSLFASIVFPLTLITSMFSMDDRYLPGSTQFWKLWAIGLPLCLGLSMGLVYGKQPWSIFGDFWEYGKSKAHARGYFLDEEQKQEWKAQRSDSELTHDEGKQVHTRDGRAANVAFHMRQVYRTDEEQAVGGAGYA